MDEINPETDWTPDDPRWHAYQLGWQAGYRAAEADLRERLPGRVVDEAVVERFAALVKMLRDRETADGVF